VVNAAGADGPGLAPAEGKDRTCGGLASGDPASFNPLARCPTADGMPGGAGFADGSVVGEDHAWALRSWEQFLAPGVSAPSGSYLPFRRRLLLRRPCQALLDCSPPAWAVEPFCSGLACGFWRPTGVTRRRLLRRQERRVAGS